MCLSISRSWSEKVPAPRAALIRFPYGATVGEPEVPEQQRAVLAALVRQGLALQQPGAIVELPFRWRRGPFPEEDLSDLEPAAAQQGSD